MSNSDLASTARVKVDSEAHEDLISLVESITFGTDGLRYQRLDVSSQLARFNKPVFFHALVDEQLVGVYVLDKRDLLVDSKPVTGYYRGVLAVATEHQNKGVGRSLTTFAMNWMAQQDDAASAISYGCIDKDNTRSLSLLSSMGAVRVSGLSMYMMYHQWPRHRCQLQQVDDQDSKRCSDSQLQDITRSTLLAFALEDAQGIVIGARAALNSFRIVEMSTAARWCTRLFVTPFAQARKRFDPDNFSYVSLSGVYIRPGSEKQWPRFLSSVLHHYQCHFAATYVDPKAKTFEQLQAAQFINRFIHSSTSDISVMVRSVNSNETISTSKTDSTVVSVWPIDA